MAWLTIGRFRPTARKCLVQTQFLVLSLTLFLFLVPVCYYLDIFTREGPYQIGSINDSLPQLDKCPLVSPKLSKRKISFNAITYKLF